MSHTIAPLPLEELETFFVYLRDHLSDNGVGVTPLFQPLPRGTAWETAELEPAFARGMATPVGEPGWRRAWVCRDDADVIIGHVDLRTYREPCSEHRVRLGVGVDRAHRGRGLGRELIHTVQLWTHTQPHLLWIDLEYLAANPRAGQLYQHMGFQHLCTIPDRFRIDGDSVAVVHMTWPTPHNTTS